MASLRHFTESEEASSFSGGFEEMVTGGQSASDATENAVQQEVTAGLSYQVETNDEDEFVIVHLKESFPAPLRVKKPSSDSESSDSSSGSGSEDPGPGGGGGAAVGDLDIISQGEAELEADNIQRQMQDSRSQWRSMEFKICRKWFYRNACGHVDNKSKCYEMAVLDIPTAVLGDASVKLVLKVIPYRLEDTEWPQRFSYVSFLLQIPQHFVYALTSRHTCTLCLDLTSHVLGDVSKVLEFCDFPGEVEIPQYCREHSFEFKFLRHTDIFDAQGEILLFCAMARLNVVHRELPPHHLEEEEDYAIIELD